MRSIKNRIIEGENKIAVRKWEKKYKKITLKANPVAINRFLKPAFKIGNLAREPRF